MNDLRRILPTAAELMARSCHIPRVDTLLRPNVSKLDDERWLFGNGRRIYARRGQIVESEEEMETYKPDLRIAPREGIVQAHAANMLRQANTP